MHTSAWRATAPHSTLFSPPSLVAERFWHLTATAIQLARTIGGLSSQRPLNDGAGNEPKLLLHAVRTVVDLIESGTRTMVGCSFGMSRSPTIAAFALAALLGEEPQAVITRIGETKSLEIKGPLWNDVAEVFPRVRRS